MPDTSGPSLPTPLAFYDPDSSSWKTSQGTFLSDSMQSSLTLPASGMTLGGRLYELPTSEPATAAPDCSSLLPTPNTLDGMAERSDEALARAQESGGCFNLKDVVPRMLPTPSAADGMGGHERRGGDRGDELLLAGLVKDVTLLPTPTTDDGDNVMGEHGTGGPDLRTTVDRMLPTPTRRDHKGHNQRHDETCLIGALTAPPSPATPPPSDDPHPTLWTDGDGSHPDLSNS